MSMKKQSIEKENEIKILKEGLQEYFETAHGCLDPDFVNEVLEENSIIKK